MCFCSYMFKLQSPSKYCPFDATHLLRHFILLPKTVSFRTCRFWCLLVLLTSFVSPLPHQQNLSLWRLFSSRETNKKSYLGWDWVNREEGGWGSCHFLVKWWAGALVGRCTHKLPIMKWASTLSLPKTKFTETECSLSHHHQLVHWYRWVPRTLT